MDTNDCGDSLSELTGECTPEGTLHFAVRRRAIKLIAWLVAHGVDVDCRVDGTTALHKAVKCGHNDVVEILLSQGADVLAVDGDGMNPLHLAASQGQFMTVKLLLQDNFTSEKLKNQRTINASIAAYDKHDRTPLHHAILSHNEESINMLLEAGADVNPGEGECDPPLFTAVKRESPLSIVQCLLDHGASVSAVNSRKETPLHIAAQEAMKEVMDLLLNYVSNASTVNVQDIDGWTALHSASANNDDKIVALLLDAGASVSLTNESGKTPLHWTARRDNEKVMRMLLKHVKQTSDLDIQDKGGCTALHYAFDNLAVDSMPTLLLEAGASISITTIAGETPLHWAAVCGSEKNMRLLLNHVKQNSDLDIQNRHGFTALHLAVKHESLVKSKMLLESGADFNVCSSDGSSALQLALKSKEFEIRNLVEDFMDGWRARTNTSFSPAELLPRLPSEGPPDIERSTLAQRSMTSNVSSIPSDGEPSYNVVPNFAVLYRYTFGF